ncbi:Retrovirus-related Pol polyprotein from transposon TNT 1-94 [Gossypium australe]|uniref:Retrovirus-related Pol polyprotein from transposon TNT 1-94 n=1 Tax=Gossypium australe TaxID=47621 RepID=A0A5B6WBF5_9ROSI|nr:Retrovirus-related Pol polyprotein from transposon TNT 1-94 [Gossypium australe]
MSRRCSRSQVKGIDFHDVFSPVVKHTSIRALLALVASYNFELEQLDVKTAFLHGDLDEAIYMQQPGGFKVEGKQYQSKYDESPQIEDEERYMSSVPYSSEVESLMYVMVCTHPDISHVVSVVSRYMSKPGLVDYVDSDYVGDLNKRRSLIGYPFAFNNYTISLKATLQATMALSTTEAKYMAITETVEWVIWLRGLFEELVEKNDKIIVYCNSQSFIHLTKDQMHHERTKHIDIQYHFVQKVVAQKDVQIHKFLEKTTQLGVAIKVACHVIIKVLLSPKTVITTYEI